MQYILPDSGAAAAVVEKQERQEALERRQLEQAAREEDRKAQRPQRQEGAAKGPAVRVSLQPDGTCREGARCSARPVRGAGCSALLLAHALGLALQAPGSRADREIQAAAAEARLRRLRQNVPERAPERDAGMARHLFDGILVRPQPSMLRACSLVPCITPPRQHASACLTLLGAWGVSLLAGCGCAAGQH